MTLNIRDCSMEELLQFLQNYGWDELADRPPFLRGEDFDILAREVPVAYYGEGMVEREFVIERSVTAPNGAVTNQSIDWY